MDFQSDKSGKLVKALAGYRAFVPSPLPRDYCDRFLAVSQKREWESWVQFLLSGVAQQSLDAVRRAARLRALRDEYHTGLQRARSSALLLKSVDGLFHHPVNTVPGAVRQLKVTQRAASQNSGKIIRAGILAEATGRARGRIFVVAGIIRAIEENLPPAED